MVPASSLKMSTRTCSGEPVPLTRKDGRTISQSGQRGWLRSLEPRSRLRRSRLRLWNSRAKSGSTRRSSARRRTRSDSGGGRRRRCARGRCTCRTCSAYRCLRCRDPPRRRHNQSPCRRRSRTTGSSHAHHCRVRGRSRSSLRPSWSGCSVDRLARPRGVPGRQARSGMRSRSLRLPPASRVALRLSGPCWQARRHVDDNSLRSLSDPQAPHVRNATGRLASGASERTPQPRPARAVPVPVPAAGKCPLRHASDLDQRDGCARMGRLRPSHRHRPTSA